MTDVPVLIHGYRLKRTCHACPEQYDVFADGTHVAYMRLRNGYFRVDVPDCGGETVYSTHPIGDGIFEDCERMRILSEAIAAIQEYYINTRFIKD